MRKIPYWVLGIAILCALAPIALSIMGYANPSSGPTVLPGDNPSMAGTYGAFLSRNLATGLIMVVAILMRSPGMMLSGFFMRIFSDILDIVNGLIAGSGFNFTFLVLILIAAPAVWYLRPMVTKTSYGGNS